MRITIKPGVGRRVPMPAGYGLRHGELLPAEGMEVERTALILKMLADGDVVRVDVAAADAPIATQPVAGQATAEGPSEAQKTLAATLAASKARSAANAQQPQSGSVDEPPAIDQAADPSHADTEETAP